MEEISQQNPARPVRQVSKRLEHRPMAEIDQAAVIREFGGDMDVAPWLDLRHRAFARERLGVREWTAADFRAEFTSRWWWRPDWMWLAEVEQTSSILPFSLPAEAAGTPKTLIGSVVLAMRGEPEKARPVVHWLIVHPRWRRRGIARAIMSHLEAAAWDAGHREIFLETHSAWIAAGKFYKALGYRDVRGETQR
jgi:GNAT superfamily N-acetyltransferase